MASRYAPSDLRSSIDYDFSSVAADENYSLYGGRAGTAALLLGLSSVTKEPSPFDLTMFPAYDFM